MSVNLELTEGRLKHKLYDALCKNPTNVVVKEWRGWTIRLGREKREKLFFNREFDFATFTKDQHGNLSLYGYEVKGYTQAKVGYKPPPFASGLDQAVVLLDQGANNSFLVLNEPDRREKEDLKRICDRFVPLVGLFFRDSFVTCGRHAKAQMRVPAKVRARLINSVGRSYFERV
jgi:hypothetical protein